ncbi:MAG: DUF2334 domain-containing protein [Thermoanaerobaculia bacterium]|nr:DUF2334 domain-containing protein [Thermoanaerobaculia bacterium]
MGTRSTARDRNDSPQRIPIALRYDDFSNHSPTEVEAGFLDALRQRNLNCAVAIVPFACDDHLDPSAPAGEPLAEEKTALLRQAVEDGTAEPVLHGHSHRRLHPPSKTHRPSEFAGLAVERQQQLLSEGKNFLEARLGSVVRFFAPPWNSYDKATLRALEKLDFSTLLAGPRFGPVLHDSPLKLLPATCELKDLQAALDQVRRHGRPGTSMVAIFHPYDFVEVDDERGAFDLDGFCGVLDFLLTQGDVEIVSWSEGFGQTGDLGGTRFRLHRWLRQGWTLVPPWLRSLYRRKPAAYLPLGTVLWWNLRNALVLTGFYGALGTAFGLAGFWLGHLIAGQGPILARTTTSVAIALGGLLLVALVRRPRWTYRHAMAAGSAAGLVAGMLVSHM